MIKCQNCQSKRVRVLKLFPKYTRYRCLHGCGSFTIESKNICQMEDCKNPAVDMNHWDGGIYCPSCYETENNINKPISVRPPTTEPKTEPDNTKKCKECMCNNEAVEMGSWAGNDYCEKCFYECERGAEQKRGEVSVNRGLGLNDCGTMSENRNAYGECDYGRSE